MSSTILDSTCLIALERINRLDLLEKMNENWLAPPAVIREFGAQPGWLKIGQPSQAALVSSLMLSLGEGESEAIALAVEHGTRIILDDRKARLVAGRLGLKITGTFGLLLRAKKKGFIPAAAEIISDMKSAGFHAHPVLIKNTLKAAGEWVPPL